MNKKEKIDKIVKLLIEKTKVCRAQSRRKILPKMLSENEIRNDVKLIIKFYKTAFSIKTNKLSIILKNNTIIDEIDLGRFRVNLNLSSKFTLPNLDVAVKNPYVNSFIHFWHPCVSKNGDVCYGKSKRYIHTALLMGSLSYLLDLIENFLNSYTGEGNYYRTIDHWEHDFPRCTSCEKRFNLNNIFSCCLCKQFFCEDEITIVNPWNTTYYMCTICIRSGHKAYEQSKKRNSKIVVSQEQAVS